MPKSTDIRVIGASLYFLPVETRVPLKFGTETLTSVTCARVKVVVEGNDGRTAVGWGETPLNVQWVWPSALPYAERQEWITAFCRALTPVWSGEGKLFEGHPLEYGHFFIEELLPRLHRAFNEGKGGEPMPWLAALVSLSAFDIATHDAYGNLHGKPVYETYTAEYLDQDLAHFLEPAASSSVSFEGLYPADFLVDPPQQLAAWHLVGGMDLLDASELIGAEPDDGYPVLLSEWIERDGLRCLKVKLRGNDWEWDYERLVRIGEIGIAQGVDWLTTDFNCTVTDPAYVTTMLDKLVEEHPRIYGMILYVEQPFPYELEEHRIEVHAVSARKPLFMDESAHDWKLVRLGRELGWTGVALKTCKTQSGALLALCWAKAHGMTLMVQDLTNPMLAQIPHVLLAAHAGTIMGVETNGMQFYPEASAPEAKVHPGLYRRRDGKVDLSTIQGPGFGYRLEEIERDLPKPAAEA